LENQQLAMGNPVPVVSTELHGAHLQAHVPAMMQIIEQLNAGAADPVQALPALQAFYQHIGETVQALAGDPVSESLISDANQSLQFAEEMINNTSKQVQKMQRDAQIASQEGGAPAQGQQDPMAAKVQEHQLKLQMAQQKAELEMSLKQAKFEQEQAMRDAENVLKMRDNLS
jgi:hypothetical protein